MASRRLDEGEGKGRRRQRRGETWKFLHTMETYSGTFEIFDTKLNKLYNTRVSAFAAVHTNDARYTRRSCRVRIEISKNFRLANWLTMKKRKKRREKGRGGNNMKPLKLVKPVCFRVFRWRKPFIPVVSTGWILNRQKNQGRTNVQKITRIPVTVQERREKKIRS